MKGIKNSKSYSSPQRGQFRGLPCDERGKVGLVVPLALAILMGFAGLVIDLGHLFVVRSTLQNAADAASLAAAASLSYGPDEVRNQALLLAQHHLILGSPVTLKPVDIDLGVWDNITKTFTVLEPAEEASANSVRVAVQRSADRNNSIPLFFMRAFGHETSDVKAVSVAHNQVGNLCGAIIGKRMVTLEKSATIDSYSSNLGSYSPGTARQNGDICSCGYIGLKSSAVVNGNTTPGRDIIVDINSFASVTGSTEPGGCPSLPDIEFGDIAIVNDNDNIEMTDEGEDPFHHNLGLRLNSSDGLTLPGGEYYFTSVEINSSASLRVAGPTVMYVEKKFKVDSSSRIMAQKPGDLIVLVSSNVDVTIGSGADFNGVIYAPNSKVVLESDVGFYGSIMAQEVILKSSARLHYDEALGSMVWPNDMEVFRGTVASSTLVQ